MQNACTIGPLVSVAKYQTSNQVSFVLWPAKP